MAFAITVHKVQGATEDKIVVDMESSCFSNHGTTYVALSRVRTIEGLFIKKFSEKKIRANPKVVTEMERLRENVIQDIPMSLILDEGNKDKLFLLHLNVRSFKNHLQDLKNEIYPNADVLCLSETFLKPTDNVDNILNKDAEILRNERVNDRILESQKGGVISFVSRDIYKECIKTPAELEAVAFKIKLKDNSHLQIINLYRKPKFAVSNFLKLINDLLLTIDRNVKTVFIGDFNENSLVDKENKVIENYMEQQGFAQCVHEPTTIHGSGLDHVYLNWTSSRIKIQVNDCYFSDHNYIILML